MIGNHSFFCQLQSARMPTAIIMIWHDVTAVHLYQYLYQQLFLQMMKQMDECPCGTITASF